MMGVDALLRSLHSYLIVCGQIMFLSMLQGILG
jgi:hypothetical protein